MTDAAGDTAAGYRIGYARCSTEKEDLRAQKSELAALGPDRVFTDEGYTGTKRDSRAGLEQAMAALRAGDTLIVTKLDRLARSVPDARAIAGEVEQRGARLQIGTMVYDPSDPMGKMFFNVLAMFAEFEADLARMRTREGMAAARRAGELRGRPASFTTAQDAEIRRMHDSGDYTIREIAGIFASSRPTIYRSLARTQPTATTPAAAQHLDQRQRQNETPSRGEQPAASETALRALRGDELVDPDTVTSSRDAETGTHRVTATDSNGSPVLVGFLARAGRQWQPQTPHHNPRGSPVRTKREALLQLLAEHTPSQMSVP